MADPNFTFKLVATGVAGAIAKGNCLVEVAADLYDVATTANRGTKRSSGISRGAAAINNATIMQGVGDVPSEVSNLGPGVASPIRVSATGSLERCTPGSGDDVVGWVEASGLAHVVFGVLPWNFFSGGGGASPGGSTGSIQANDGAGGLTGYSTALVGNGYVALGSSPANGFGAVRLSYGITNGVTSNNSSGDDQVTLIVLRTESILGLGTDLIQIGPGGYNTLLHVGTGRTLYAAADTYSFLRGNGGAEIFRAEPYGVQFGGGGADFGSGQGVIGIDNASVVPSTNPTGGIVLYAESGVLKYRKPDGTIVVPSSGGTPAGSTDEVQINNAGAFGAATNVKAGSGYVSIGSGSVASGGLVRASSSTAALVAVRNGADTQNLSALHVASDVLYVGTNNSFTSANSFDQVQIAAKTGGMIQFSDSATTLARFNSTALRMAIPVAGSSTDTVPFRFARAALTISGNTTLSAAQYECPFIDLNGSPGGAFDVVAPNLEGATFNVINNTGQTAAFKKSGGSGLSIGSTSCRWAHHDGTDYEGRGDG